MIGGTGAGDPATPSLPEVKRKEFSSFESSSLTLSHSSLFVLSFSLHLYRNIQRVWNGTERNLGLINLLGCTLYLSLYSQQSDTRETKELGFAYSGKSSFGFIPYFMFCAQLLNIWLLGFI